MGRTMTPTTRRFERAKHLAASSCFVLLAACTANPAEVDGGTDTEPAATTEVAASESSSVATDESETGSTGGSALHTYHADARPILERHCTRCHSEDGIAFGLTDYEDVAAYREAIAVAVDQGTMPPWGIPDGCNTFEGDFSLSDDDRQLLTDWIDDDAPEGDAAEYVPPESLPVASLSRTDLTLELPEPYRPQLEPDDYRCFVLDWPHDDPMFLTGVEIAPDNAPVVHHLLLYLAEPEWVDDFQALDEDDSGPGYTCFGGPGGGTLPGYSGPTLAVWAPGSQVGDFPEGTGIAIPPGSKLIVQVHYNTLADNGLPDQSRVMLKTDRTVEREAHLMPWVAPQWRVDGGMRIPAGEAAAEHEFVATVEDATAFLAPQVPTDVDLEVHMATHHMHGLGATGRLEVARDDGSDECLVDLPKYDYNWQLMYRLSEPAIVRPQDQLRMRCSFDNSAGGEDVFWGDGTAEEMCLGFLYVVPR